MISTAAIRNRHGLPALLVCFVGLCCAGQLYAVVPDVKAAADYRKEIAPILTTYCGDCHADGAMKGNVALDEFQTDDALVHSSTLWWSVLKNTRAGIMPPPKKPRPTAAEQAKLERWIKYEAFGSDPKAPDPGRVTLHRLNRLEYRNTIRDLLGVDFHTDEEFPGDDSGYGFDNIGDVLTTSPLLIEKYVQAAESIVVAEVAPPGTKPAKASRAFERFLTRSVAPKADPARHAYAAEVLRKFATRAYRRPVDERTVDRLVGVAEHVYNAHGKQFEDGIAQAMIAVLASPRFLFRFEDAQALPRGETYAQIDEYALASRLSYFFWSTMPDEELLALAGRGELRKNLGAQVNRLVADPRSHMLIDNFVGQWLEARDVENTPINGRVVLTAEGVEVPPKGTPRQQFDRNLREVRTAMRVETEMYFARIVHEDRSVIELLDSDYTFLNEKLAKHYGIPGVTGKEMRLVTLPKDSPRGGVLTQGTMLLVTSNPTRTSPVKRGLFILENILGAPQPPPPPDVPLLEEAAKQFTNREPTMREIMEIHRAKPLCSSCHSRMDPLGFGLENFNALGMFRTTEHGQAIDVGGKLLTGETFTQIRELKRILKENHRTEFYRCLSEKLLTYALGRGLEWYDVETVDQLVGKLESGNGKFSTLLMGIVQSAPFEQCRAPQAAVAVPSKIAPVRTQTRSTP